MASATFAAIFLAVILSEFHAPAPHDLPVGIVGSAQLTSHVGDALDRAVPGGFSLRHLPSGASALAAIAHRQVDGALVGSRSHLRLLVASGGGTAPAQFLIRTFGAVAAQAGRHLRVIDVAPPLAGDTQALSPFFVILAVLFPSLGAGSASALAFRRAPRAWCVAAPVAAAAVIGVVAAAIADGVAGLGHYTAIAAIVALFSVAVAAPTALLARIWPPLVALAILAFIVFAIPVSGGPGNLAGFGPGFLRALGSALPLPVAAGAVRNVVYFGSHATAMQLWVLAAWALAGLAGLVLVAILRRPAPAAAPDPVMPSVIPPDPAVTLPDRVPAGCSADAGARQPARPAGSPALPAAAAAPAALPVAPVALPTAPVAPPVAPVALVVGFDNSEPARRALSWATRLLSVRPGALHVVYADHALIDSDLSGFAHAEMEHARDERATGVAESAAEITAAARVRCTFERREGSPADAILSAASVHAAAEPGSSPVIVAGRSAHAAHHVIGSVPARLLNHSPYPVFVIP